MSGDSSEQTEETPGREVYYEAALTYITLFCDRCSNFLSPDDHLAPGQGFPHNYMVPLGDEAFKRGWLIDDSCERGFRILCPTCAAQSDPVP